MRISTSKKWRIYFNEFAQLESVEEKRAWLKQTITHCNQHLGIKSKKRYDVKASLEIFNLVEDILKRLYSTVTFHRPFMIDRKMSQEQIVKLLHDVDFQVDTLDQYKKEIKSVRKQIVKHLKRSGVKFKAKTKSQKGT
jgi:hypothetical protein